MYLVRLPHRSIFSLSSRTCAAGFADLHDAPRNNLSVKTMVVPVVGRRNRHRRPSQRRQSHRLHHIDSYISYIHTYNKHSGWSDSTEERPRKRGLSAEIDATNMDLLSGSSEDEEDQEGSTHIIGGSASNSMLATAAAADGSNTDSHTSSSNNKKTKRRVGEVFLISCADYATTTDNHAQAQKYPSLVRSQPHIRGNWAVHVYIKLSDHPLMNHPHPPDMYFQDIALALERDTTYCGPLLLHDKDLHLSLLRRPFYLQLASIDGFVQKLTQLCQFEHDFMMHIMSSQLVPLTNDDGTRTFFALPVVASDSLKRLRQHVRTVLSRYQPVSDKDDEFLFHVSVASILPPTAYASSNDNGNKDRNSQTLTLQLPQLRLPPMIMPPITIHEIHVRFGTTKHFVIPLQSRR
jgi:hypothetical protein